MRELQDFRRVGALCRAAPTLTLPRRGKEFRHRPLSLWWLRCRPSPVVGCYPAVFQH